MKTSLVGLILVASIVLGGCAATTQSSPLKITPTVTADLSPTPSTIPPSEALDFCRKPQVAVTPGQSGAGLGTAYLRVFVELAEGPACSLPRSPMVAVTDAFGTEVARATETDPTPITLDHITGYEIGWNAPCDQLAPTGPLTGHITFSPTLVIDMPIGDFGPSCVDGTERWSISMIADDRN